METKPRKQYSSSFQSLEAIWNVLRAYSSEEHPMTVRDIYNHLAKTEDTPPSPHKLEQLLSQSDSPLNTLFPTLSVRQEECPSYSTVDNLLKRIPTDSMEQPYPLRCVAHKRRWNGEIRTIDYLDLESAGEGGRQNNVPRRYYLEGPLTPEEWKFLSDFLRDCPMLTSSQTRDLSEALNELSQPKQPWAPADCGFKPKRSDIFRLIGPLTQAIREYRRVLLICGEYRLEQKNGRLTPVLRPGEPLKLEPYALMWVDGRYCLVGRHRDMVITPLHKILGADVLSEAFTPSAAFDPADFRGGAPMTPAGRRAVVRLRCAAAMADTLTELFGQSPQYSNLREDGTVEVMVPTVPERVKALALRCPDRVEVLEPEGLRRDILQTLQRGLSLYGP